MMKTPWTDSVSQSLPLAEYPRPQMVREKWFCLNGKFDYAITPVCCEPASYDGEILVPFAVESSLSGVERKLYPNEWLWYKRSFRVDAKVNERVLLHFGAVDWQCCVWVNQIMVGTHKGGYTPFSFDITDYIKEDENSLVVRVYDPTDKGHQQRGKQVLSSHGFWYTATSGIWQTVWLEIVPKSYIKSIRLTPNIDKETIRIQSEIVGDCSQLSVAISDGESCVFNGTIAQDEEISVPNPKYWTPESPFLYDVELVLNSGEGQDVINSYFAMRKFSVGKDEMGLPRLFLNNKPYFQCGLLDQGYWSDGGLTAPCDEAMRFDIQRMKDLGFNMLRKHIKVEPLRWYYHCDKIGMLVWQDMVSGGEYIGTLLAGALPNVGIRHIKDDKYTAFKREKAEWREEFETELFEMIESLYNCPSICCWVPFNEAWGQFDAKRIGDAVKRYDTTRFVDHASGWYDQGGGDFNSIHKYILKCKLPKLDDRPFVLSEFGGYSQIVPDHVWNIAKSFGYKMYKSKASLTSAYKKLIENEILPLIPKGLSATVYTQVSDVEFEVNGMFTYDRQVLKLDESTVLELNQKIKNTY